MKLYLTGGNSFLGKNLLPMLKNNGVEYWAPPSKEVDILNFDQFNQAIQNYNPDAILHMSAKCAGILGNKNSPAVFLRDNTQMGLNVYEIARLNNIKQVYSLGSICSYPLNTPVPFKEENLFVGYPEPTNAPYGQAKRTLLMLSQTYREQFGIGGAFFMPVNLYGPYDHFDDLVNSHVIPAIIRKVEDAITYDLSHIECFGTGTHYREFLYSGDCASVLVKAISTNFDHPEPINLGTGKTIQISDLIYLIKDLMGYEGDIVFKNDGMDGQKFRQLDISRVKQLLNWDAPTSLNEGLMQTIKWYRKNK